MAVAGIAFRLSQPFCLPAKNSGVDFVSHSGWCEMRTSGIGNLFRDGDTWWWAGDQVGVEMKVAGGVFDLLPRLRDCDTREPFSTYSTLNPRRPRLYRSTSLIKRETPQSLSQEISVTTT